MCTEDEEEADKTKAASIRDARQALLASRTMGATSDRTARAMVGSPGVGLGRARGIGQCRQ